MTKVRWDVMACYHALPSERAHILITHADGIWESPVRGTLLIDRFPDNVIFLSSLIFPATAWRRVDLPLGDRSRSLLK